MKDNVLIKTLGIVLTLFIIAMIVVPAVGSTPMYFQRGFALLLSLVLGVLYKPTQSTRLPTLARFYDILIIALSVAGFGYLMLNSTAIVGRIGAGNIYDLVSSLISFIVVMEVARRWTPPALMILVLAFAAYAFLGHLIPSRVIGHPRISGEQFFTYTMTSQEGILGSGVAVMVNVIFIFMVLSAVLKLTGIGEFILNISKALVGRFTGGPALAAVVGSSLFGMVSGSPVANVAAVGTITIPMMIRMGYNPFFAGAVEAVSSTGGQIMPPILGSVAFFISEVTGTPYIKIAVYSLIPALIYYGSVGLAVSLEAWRQGITGLPKSELPLVRDVMKKGWYSLIPLVALIVLLALDFTPQKAAWYAIITAVLIGVMKKAGWKKFVDAMVESAHSSLGVMIAVAAIGIVVASLALTGLAPKIATMVASVTQVYWMLGLLVIALFGIVLGMGLPPLPAYIVMFVAVARLIPYLGSLGFNELSIHMFMFYYAALAPITPPVALAAYTAAGIANTDPFKVGWRAFGIALPAFALPFLFVQHEQLLLMGDLWPGILLPLLKALILIFAGSLTVIGWLIKPIGLLRRLASVVAVVLVILPVSWSWPLALLMVLLIVISGVYNGGISKRRNGKAAGEAG